ncbi:GlxA family transcriptional regulator [Jiella flava]|uniref:GlxA family transcriptional regulator n=1 Tax=Jiella flava TaxID=2816857 RepID=UPI003CCF8FA3
MSRLPDSVIKDIGFVLLPGFALMSFAAASEPFRAANVIAGQPLYRLRCFGESARTVAASQGASIAVEPLSATLEGPLDAVLVCAGGYPATWHRPAIHAMLRRLARKGVRLGGISGGAYLLAAAGLLQNRAFTVHWEHASALSEAFPELRPRQARFVIDRDRITCGGGIAPLDMAHALIRERMGATFARQVSDWLLHTEIGTPAAAQRGCLAERYQVHHPILLSVLETMEATVEAPLSRQAMARDVGLSMRQLDRLFAAHRHTTFAKDYLRIRLERAHLFLRQSALPIAEIAFATGFANQAHFARRFRAHFGMPPSQVRRVDLSLGEFS